ncbi:MAG: hypothetical protein ACPGLV_05915, partial [Bacteroidia bacterium]
LNGSKIKRILKDLFHALTQMEIGKKIRSIDSPFHLSSDVLIRKIGFQAFEINYCALLQT